YQMCKIGKLCFVAGGEVPRRYLTPGGTGTGRPGAQSPPRGRVGLPPSAGCTKVASPRGPPPASGGGGRRPPPALHIHGRAPGPPTIMRPLVAAVGTGAPVATLHHADAQQPPPAPLPLPPAHPAPPTQPIPPPGVVRLTLEEAQRMALANNQALILGRL